MKINASAAALAVALVPLLAGVAHARNPHCAGGIQYVVQGMRDKDKGNVEDYQRQMMKAVQQLEMCQEEDPADAEAIGYLGWAYAEVDSARLAGAAFQKAEAGISAKGDKKKLAWVNTNRESYWAKWFNEGIGKIQDAQNAYPDYTKKAENEADQTLRDEAGRKYQEALTSLDKALWLKPGDARTLRNKGSVYAFMGDYPKAEETLTLALAAKPDDQDVAKSLMGIRANRAGVLIDEKKYDEAIAYYQKLIEGDATNSDLHLGLAEAYFKRAQEGDGDPRKADFKHAGDAYTKAAALKADNADLPFNAALAYQNGGEYALAEAQWARTLTLRPADEDAMSSLGAALAEQKKFDAAIQTLHKAVVANPKNKTLHRQLGAVYTKAGNNAKGTEQFMVYLALNAGKPVEDPAALAQKAAAGSGMARTLASSGAPEAIVPWEADGKKYESWFYWGKNTAYHFSEGVMLSKSDWGAAAPAGGAKK